MKYQLVCGITVSAYTTVEANSLEEAIEEAYKRGVELGGPGTSHDDLEVWVVEEADGMPSDIAAA